MEYWVHVTNLIAIFGLLALTLNFVMGFAGLFSLAHAAFFGIGAYSIAILVGRHGWSYPGAVLIGLLIACAVGGAVGVVALRVRSHYFVMLTLVFQLVVTDVISNWVAVTNGTTGIFGIRHPTILGMELVDPTDFLPFSILLLVAIASLSIWLSRSPMGKALRAMREDEDAARAIGKNVFLLKLEVFAVSGALAALAGSWYSSYVSYIEPNAFNLFISTAIMAMVALGGVGNAIGPAAGALIVIFVPEALRFLDIGAQTATLQQFVFGSTLVFLMRFRPQGLFAEPRGRADKGSALTVPSSVDRLGASVTRNTLEGRDLAKRFGGNIAVNGIDIAVEPGSVLGLVGPNGAGKTTLFNVLGGALVPDSGSIDLNNSTITNVSVHGRVRLGIGRTFQDVRLFSNLSVLENVLVAVPGAYGEHFHQLLFVRKVMNRSRLRRARAASLLADLELAKLQNSAATDVSFSEQRRLSLARLLATEADVVLLDEPASGMDITSARRLHQIVRGLAEAGAAVCVVEHNMDAILSMANVAVFMDQGRIIAQGVPAELIRRADLTDIYFGSKPVRYGDRAEVRASPTNPEGESHDFRNPK